jgi:hypothetical protein
LDVYCRARRAAETQAVRPLSQVRLLTRLHWHTVAFKSIIYQKLY